MLPVVELRGAIPYGFAFDLPWWLTYLASVAGNLLPVPFIILFIRRIFAWLKNLGPFANMIYRLERKAVRGAAKLKNGLFIGLFLFVAIPLPGTGAWTGALIAAFLDLRLKKALPAITAGVLAAGIAVSIMTYGLEAVIHLFG